MSKLNVSPSGIVMLILEIIVGVVLLIDPVGFLRLAIILFGAGVLLAGIVYLIRFIQARRREETKTIWAVDAGIGILLGLFCLIGNQWIVESFAALAFICGILLVLLSIMKIQWALELRRRGKAWLASVLSAVLSIAIAILILLHPFSVMTTLWRFTGISMIVVAVIDLLVIFNEAANMKKLDETEAEQVE